uniref:Microtubule actin crosslinking factor 1 n=1 Tax=Pseudonaja textilis TaxID=8673 RepID=A0A670ZFK0_PSETE
EGSIEKCATMAKVHHNSLQGSSGADICPNGKGGGGCSGSLLFILWDPGSEKGRQDSASYRSEPSCKSERSYRSERSGSLSPCPPGDTLPWNLPLHEQKKRKSQDSVLDPAERAVVRVADERDRVQKKTFTKWVNKHLMKVRKHINDLYEDLRDGHNLISLLEVLSGVKLPEETSGQKTLGLVKVPPWSRLGSEDCEEEEEPREKGRMRFHRLQNVQIALDFLKQRQVKLVNIRNDDITDGNPKLTLGLIWTIILHFQISDIYISGESGDMSAKEKLLLWSQKVTAGYVGLKCTNFSSCWSDGKMFNAVIHRYRPDLVDMERVYLQSNQENLEQAFEIAERLGVTRLLDSEDVDVPSPDEKSVITYVSSIYDAFPKVPEGGEGISATEVDTKWLEYQTCVETLISWIKQHTIQMSDKSFPQNPVKLKALYNQYIHFKETEIPTKQLEKRSIEELYKLLEVWIEFGRLKLPQGYHPNNVEEEWGKLIIEMLEREKLLRPAVERLELLLQRANKIQNGTLSCEEKLTLARNTLQADEAHLESGQPVQYESDVVMYLQECEGLLRQLQADVQILRDENYYQLEELVFKIVRLQDELVTLRLECTNLYRKGHFSSPSSLDLAQPSSLSTRQVKTEPLLKGTIAPPASASWIRKPMTRMELVSISSSEDEGSLRFVYELLSWVEELQVRYMLERSEWGNDLPTVEAQLEVQRQVHSSVEGTGSSVKEARMYEGKMSSNFRASYTETLGKLETQYCKLMETSSFRLRHLQSLYEFVSQATTELIWLNEKEEEELAYDWSENNPNLTTKKNYFSELTEELEEKQDVFRALQDSAELLSLENHPAKQTVEAYSAAVQTQWHWIKQLCLCVDQHLRENTAYFQFFGDARESEMFLKNLQDNIKRKYSCDRNTSLTRLEDLLQDSMDEKEQLIQSKSSVGSLVGRSKSIVQLKPRNPESPLKSTISVKAACDYHQIEITICRNDECVLKDNAQRTKWKVISPAGNEATVPSVCFLVPPPNREAIEMASRVEQLYQKVMSLWHQLHVNMKSLVSWNYLRKDIALLRALAPGECHHVVKNLQVHFEDFLEDSRDSEIFSLADRLHLEEEVDACKENFQRLLQSMENEDKDETASRTYLSELKNIRLHLEECEQRLVGTIRTPSSTRTDGDALQENTFRMAEQERLKGDLHQLRVDLDQLAERCHIFLHKSPTGSSTPQLRTELNLLVEKMDQVYGLSAVYLDKLKMVDVIIQNTQGAESLVKGYEVKLSQEEAVPADIIAIQSHRHWISEVNTKSAVFATLEDDLARAKGVADQLYRLKQERSLDLEHYQEKGAQLWDRWQRVNLQMETRKSELENIEDVLRDYRNCHGALVQWIEQTTAQQELMKPGQAEDSRVLSEQLSQQMDPDYCSSRILFVLLPSQEYELQLMTYRAFVESQQKSPVKRRRVLSSSDAITQEFMDLRTHYTALVTLTTQHVKYISDALRRLEEEEVRTEFGLNEELAAKKEEVSEAIKTTQIFLAHYSCDSDFFSLFPPPAPLSQGNEAIAGVLDLGTMEVFSIFDAMQKGLLDQETGLLLLEVQVVTAGLVVPSVSEKLSLAECLTTDEINGKIYQHLEEMQDAVQLIQNMQVKDSPFHPVVAAIKNGIISENTGLKIAQVQLLTGNFIDPSSHEQIGLEDALQKGIITNHFHEKLVNGLKSCEEALTDPNSAEKISFRDLLQQCVPHQETGLKLFPLKQEASGGMLSLQSGPEAAVLSAVHEGLVEKEGTMALLGAHLFAGGLEDPERDSQLTVEEAGRHHLIKQELVCDLVRQLQTGGILDPLTGERLSLQKAVEGGLVTSRLAVMILESLRSFVGLVRPESGEIVSVTDSLEQGILTSELADKILRGRQNITALFEAETNEILPWKRAVDCGILNKDVAKTLKSTCLPDFIPGMPLSGPSSSFQRRSSSSAQPAGHGAENKDPLRSCEERMLLYLMTHSYVNIHNGEKLLLVDEELNSLSEILVPAKGNGSSIDPLEAGKMQPQEWCGDVGKNAAIDLSAPVNEELEAVEGLVASSPQEVPEQLLRALEKDAKNLLKSFGSVSDALASWLLNLHTAAEAEKVLPSLRAKHIPGGNNLSSVGQFWHSNSPEKGWVKVKDDSYSMWFLFFFFSSHTKSQLDETASNTQFFISEHVQDLSPEQSGQLLRLLNDLQRSFRELLERVTPHTEVLQVCLQPVELMEEMTGWTSFFWAALSLIGSSVVVVVCGSLVVLQDLCRSLHSRTASFTSILKATEDFLEENRIKLPLGELESLQEKLHQAQGQYLSLQERLEAAQKELESAVSSVVQQQTEKVGHFLLMFSFQVHHQELLSHQQDVILATQSAQGFLDRHNHNLTLEEKQDLQRRLGELKDQYAASLSQTEGQLKQVQALRDELQKFLRDHQEFAAWLEQAEQDLEKMCAGDGSLESLQPVLLQQSSFSEDVISHKGDLRFVTMSGQKVLDAETAVAAARGGELCPEISATRTLVESKLEDASRRYGTLHSKCSALGLHLNLLLDRSRQFQDVAESLRSWLQESEEAVTLLLVEPISSDPAILQRQLANTKVSQQVHLLLGFNLLQTFYLIQGSSSPRRQAALLSPICASFLLQKLKQDIARQKSSLEATREMVTRFMESADSTTAAALQTKLADVTQRFSHLWQQQQEKEDTWKKILPQVEQYEQLSEKLKQFLESRGRMLALGNQPEQDIVHFAQQIQMTQRHEDLDNLEHLTTELSSCGLVWTGFSSHQEKVHSLRKEFTQLEKGASSCQEQLDVFRKLVGSLRQWLEETERNIPAPETSLGTQELEKRRQQTEVGRGERRPEAFLGDLEQNAVKVQAAKESLSGLLKKYPDSPEARNWKRMLEDLSTWANAKQVTEERQQKLEKSANELASFQEAEGQLRPWLMEKELMMSVLGPLSIDPNMLNAQKQQVQFMLKEFEARKHQYDQLNEAARGIPTSPGETSPPHSHVQEELQAINRKWTKLTERLNSRSSQIDQAVVKSTQFQELLQGLSEKVKAAGQRLSTQPAISTQPEAVKQQLEETSEIRSELEQLEEEITEAQALCEQLSVLMGEQYLKDELRKRDRLNRLQTALASSQQFQQMFDELHTWLEDRLKQQAESGPISARLERLQCQIQEQEESQKSLNQHSGSYEMIVAEEESLLLSVHPGEEKTTMQNQLVSLKANWEELSKQIASRHAKLKDCLQKAQKYQRHVEDLFPWVEDCRSKMLELEVTLDLVQLEAALLRSKAMLSDVAKRRSLLEMLNSAADVLIDASEMDEDDIRDEKAEINHKMDVITEELQAKTESLEEMSQRLKEFQESFRNIEKKLEGTKHQLEIYEALGPQACSNKNLEKLRAQQEALQALGAQVDYLRNFTQGLVEDTPDGSDSSHLLRQAEIVQQDFKGVKQKVNECCKIMENKLEGIGLFNNHVREMFSQLTDLDDELDSMGPVGRDMDSLQSQADDAQEFLGKLHQLRLDIQASEEKCRQMLDEEGSPDLIGLKRELETLNKQCIKLTERGKSRLEQVETTLARVKDFYNKLKELNYMTTAAEEGEALQWVVGTEVDVINQQLADFKVRQFQKEQVDPLQLKLQQVNGLGQGLVQSAGKNCDVQGLEHDMEEISTRWNTLNKKVAQRIAQLQEALLHCGKFQDALEPLLSWLADTEELISNQKPPSAEYKVVKAQIQEQKLLQRLLDDRKATVDMIQAEGDRIARSAEPADREKIVGQLTSLGSHWASLLSKASSQLEEILVLAKQFHETSEPISEWLSVTEKKLANSEPIGTQTAKIQQQIARHKALEEEIDSQATAVTQVVSIGHSLALLSCHAEQASLAEKLDLLESRYAEVCDRCGRKAALLDQALSNARLFGEDEVEVLNWLAEVEDKLSLVSVKDYRREVLQQQHSGQLVALNDEIVNRKKHVDQAMKNGQALLKQTTGEEVLLIQEKLDGIKTRYSDITAASSKALRTLEQARQLATKFQSTHEELTGWMGQVEEELRSGGGPSPAGEQIPRFQQRQKELKKEVMEHQVILDTVNEVSHALLELVPWRAREGLDKLVSDANERYKATSDTINQRVAEIDAAIQRSQQYEQAADAELAWVAETRRKLLALGPVRLEQDQTTAQLQVQKAFSVDIIRHKDSVDELLSQRTEILGTCGEEQKVMLQKTESLLEQYEETSHLHSERYARLERAQVLVNQFWETYEELSPWLEETQVLIGQLPPPAIDHEHLKQQQEDMRQLRESIAEHKPHIDKLLKIGPQLTELNPEEGAMVQGKYFAAEAAYSHIKEEVHQRALALDEAISQSTQFHDKIEPMLETLESLSSRLRMPPLIPAEVEKIRECIGDNKNATLELEKLQPSFEGLKRRGEELIRRSQGADRDLAAKNIQDKLDQMVFFWEDIKARAEEREIKFLDVLELAEKFWYDMAALLTTIRDTQDIVHDLESPGIDPSIIKQQIEAAETIKEETDGLHEELEFIRILGADLIFACGETEKPEVKKSIDEMNSAWEQLNRTWKERLEKLEEAMQSAVQYQDNLQAMFDWLDNTVIKLCNMSPVGTDLNTVKEQLNEMKEFKTEVYQQQIEMEKLNHQGELLLKKATDETDRDIIREPLTELKHLWENLGEKIAHRQHKLEGSLLALGQFQHALAELMAWLTHTEELLDSQKAINGDPRVIEVELAKHHVLKNDVLAHQATVETVNKAGNELLESSARDDASSLRSRLETMNSCWESILQKTEVREQQLQATLQQAQGFHGEIESFLLWLTRMESQLSASKATGGLPETAREQLSTHMELYAQLKANEEIYSQLLAKGRLMLLSQDDAGSGSKMEQSVALLEQKWALVSTKMEERKSKLEEALNLATEFQNSLQDFINWLTLAEQSLNVASPPSLIHSTVLSQVDEHKGFANEVNAHRHQIIALDQSGNQLKFLSQKQDVVLIKNLLVSVQSRWEKVVQRSVERGRALDDARKRAKQFHEAWRKLVDWLEDAENNLNSELEISNDPDKIKLQLSKHKEFQKTLGGKQPVYDTTIRTGRALKEKAHFPDDTQNLDHLLGEVRDKWDTVCGKSVERQHKLEEALLFSGQFMDALQALVDWLYKVEPQLAEDQPVHGDLDLVMNSMDAHKVFQKELGKRTGTVQVLKRSGRELIENSRDDTTWVKVQLQELSNRWDTVCKMSVLKQTRLEQALKQAEEFRTAIHQLLEWLSEAEQTLRFRGALPDDAEALQSLIDVHKEFMKKVEEKRLDVNSAVGMGEAILSVCHPDCVTTIKHWITIIRARFEEVLTWAKQHQQRLEAALLELRANAELLEELLAWIQWAEATLIQRDQEPQNIEQVKALIAEHQSFMEEMTRKQPDVDRVTKTYKRKVTEPTHGSFMEKSRSNSKFSSTFYSREAEAKNPRINQLSARWQQVWLLALERQRKLNDALDRLEELKEFANFDFDVWRKKYMRWMNHKKSRVMDFFRRIDKDQDGKITRQEFIDGILASKFPTTKLEMTAVADIFDRDGDGYIDYYEFVAALHPNKDAYRPTTDADKIEDEVTRQVAQCKCAKRFQVEQIGENKYRFFLGNQFGDSQQLRLVRILRSTVMVRVGGGWMALDEFLVKNDPCRGRSRLCSQRRFFQGNLPYGRLPRREDWAAEAGSKAPEPFALRTPHHFTRCYDKPWLVNSKAGTPLRGCDNADLHLPASEVEYGSCGQKEGLELASSLLLATPRLSSKRRLRNRSRGCLPDPKKTASRPTSRAGSHAGSRTSSRRGSDASDFDLLETQSACSDTSESSATGGGGGGGGGQGGSRRGPAKPSKIPTIQQKPVSSF